MKTYRRQNRRRLRLIDVDLERRASRPAPHIVVKHKPPRLAKRGGVEVYVWSEAKGIPY